MQTIAYGIYIDPDTAEDVGEKTLKGLKMLNQLPPGCDDLMKIDGNF